MVSDPAPNEAGAPVGAPLTEPVQNFLNFLRPASYCLVSMKPGSPLLEALYDSEGQFVATGKLRARLGLSARELGAAVRRLESAGYSIETHPHLGYRLVSGPDQLNADDLKARLAAVRRGATPGLIGSEIVVLAETSSTNDVVEHLAATGGREGLVVFAESQTLGRGRHGRSWSSPAGKGLWFSVLLRPPLPPGAVPRITVAASVAVARALRRATGLDVRIKWPNDVMSGGRKLAGILTELRGEADAISLAVLGIGIDVNCVREDFPLPIRETATSLRIETGRSQDRTELAVAVLGALEECYQTALTDFGQITDEWARWCSTLGKHIAVQMAQRRLEGFAMALDGDGALLLRRDSGQIQRILSGDLVLERA